MFIGVVDRQLPKLIGGGADRERWVQLGNPLTGLVLGHTTVKDAAVFQRSIPTVGAVREVTDELVTETLNVASGLGNSKHNKNNATVSCGGKERRRWFCMAGAVAEVVVSDLRERVVPVQGHADPVVVLMVQEARPIIVDAIAEQMSFRFRRSVSTLFVSQEPDASVSNTQGGYCDDGGPPESYRCEYGNALIATVPLVPLAGVNFNHRPENRMFVAAMIRVGTALVTVGTYHAQLDHASRKGQQAEERAILQMLGPSLFDPIIIGGDFNDRDFDLFDFTKQDVKKKRVDAFLSRPHLDTSGLGTCRARKLKVKPYELDHRRVALKWARM